jgi:hypothetical protein
MNARAAPVLIFVFYFFNIARMALPTTHSPAPGPRHPLQQSARQATSVFASVANAKYMITYTVGIGH